MHCDRVSDESRDQRRSRERASEHDDREARYWTRKLYEFEANDPDRYRTQLNPLLNIFTGICTIYEMT